MNDTDSPSAAVELRGVSKRFGSRVILDRVDLQVAQGEVLALVGPSGSGKSTLLHLVSGIETPDEGHVFLAGNDCTRLPPYRRPVHTVFQSYALFPHLNVADNVAFPLAIAGRSRAERTKLIERALGWVKLTQHASRRVQTLSGGERQRVALARALVDSPQCVLLDEPLSALDPHLRAETLELLEDIQRRLATTFLFVTHDRDEALRLAHRIGVLNGGRLEQLGAPEEVYRRPATPFVASFMGKINWLQGEVRMTDGQKLVVINGQAIAAPASVRFTGNARVGIRPEDVQTDLSDGLEARIMSRQFLGDCTHITVELAGGATMVCNRREPAELLSLGQRVLIGWQPEAAHVFPADSEEQHP